MLAAGYAVAHAQPLLIEDARYLFRNLRDGLYDTHHQTIADKIAAWYDSTTMPTLYWRLGWEANSNYPWGVSETSQPQTPKDERGAYAAGWARIGWIYKDTIPGD